MILLTSINDVDGSRCIQITEANKFQKGLRSRIIPHQVVQLTRFIPLLYANELTSKRSSVLLYAQSLRIENIPNSRTLYFQFHDTMPSEVIYESSGRSCSDKFNYKKT